MGSIYFYFYQDKLLYIGSTFDMKRRIIEHKSRLKCDSNIPFYKYLRENSLVFHNLEIEIVEAGINDKEELRLLEGKCITLYKPKCNIEIPGSRNFNYKEYQKEYHKEYQKTDKWKEYQKKWYLTKKLNKK